MLGVASDWWLIIERGIWVLGLGQVILDSIVIGRRRSGLILDVM